VVPAGEFLRGWIPEGWSHNGGGGGHRGWFFVDRATVGTGCFGCFLVD
jgi:hypothetical protein